MLRGVSRSRLCRIFLCLFACATLDARAVDILLTSANTFFDPNDSTRVGIEVEFVGLGAERSAQIVAQVLGGTVKAVKREVEYHLENVEADGTRVYGKTIEVTDYVVDTRIGEVILKTEMNLTAEDSDGIPQVGVVELVTRPIIFPQVLELQKAMDALKRAGARGTEGVNPVATQVNVEIANGKVDELRVNMLVDLMRNYMYGPHREQILERLKIASRREPFLRPYSPGFLKRLLDPKYQPTKRELYDDFIYRQSLELLGDKDAWTISVSDARSRFLAKPDQVVARVVKCNPLRISSLLMMLVPEDPVTQIYANSEWARALPIIEFREWNTEFDVVTPVKQALGLITATNRFGAFDHDQLISTASGVDIATLKDLRSTYEKKGEKEPILFRYFLEDPANHRKNEWNYDYLYPHYQGTNHGFLPANTYGHEALVIPGESVVYHRRPYHRFSIMGRYNPALINFNISQALENKYVEARFWNEFVPKAMPRSKLLLDYIQQRPTRAQIKELLDKFNRDFPAGWVLKGTWDLGSEKNIVTDRSDVLAALETYYNSDFDSKLLAAQAKHAQSSPDSVLYELKGHKGLAGWKILRLLENPYEAFLQERVNIKYEFRVEVVAGRVLGNGSTVDRYAYMYKWKEDRTAETKDKKYEAPPPEMLERAEIFAQNVVDALPLELRGMPMGMDVAILADGRAVMIESNPGGNSTFLQDHPPTIKAMTAFLRQYPEMLRQGSIHEGMDPEDQMEFLREKFRAWGISLAHMYEGMQFLENRIEDPEFKPIPLGKTERKKMKQNCSAKLSGK